MSGVLSFEKGLIFQSVRWYVSHSSSYYDLKEIMKERGFEVDHSTVNRRVAVYSPQIDNGCIQVFDRLN